MRVVTTRKHVGMRTSRQRQQGVALIMGLMVLVLVSAAGVATMESSGMQLKMTSATEARQQAFEAAEIGLRLVEERVWSNTESLAENDNMAYECAGSDCFKPDCTNGRCFQGLWLAGDSVKQCKIVDDGEYESVSVDADADADADCASAFSEAKDKDDGESDSSCDSSSKDKDKKANSNSSVSVPPPVYNAWESGTDSDYLNVWDDEGLHMTLDLDTHDQPVKYIVEFLCFTPADPVAELSDSNYAQVFRITTRSMSDSGRAEVMLQSTYKRLL